MTTEITLYLADHEATIEQGLKTFVEVGNALAAIRDGKLYKADHATFEDYCKVRWGWNDRRASQLIAAAGIAGNVSTIVGTAPTTESQARPLTKLPADEQADAWEEVVADAESTGEKITAKKVEAVVAKRRGEQVVVDTDTGEVIEPGRPKPKPPAHKPSVADTGKSIAELLDDLETMLDRPASQIPAWKALETVRAIKSLYRG